MISGLLAKFAILFKKVKLGEPNNEDGSSESEDNDDEIDFDEGDDQDLLENIKTNIPARYKPVDRTIYDYMEQNINSLVVFHRGSYIYNIYKFNFLGNKNKNNFKFKAFVKSKSVVGMFNHSSILKEQLSDHQKKKHKPQLNVVQSMPIRWNSIYLMIDRLIEIRESLEVVLIDANNRKYILKNEEK